jgi:hypothetical protein
VLAIVVSVVIKALTTCNSLPPPAAAAHLSPVASDESAVKTVSSAPTASRLITLSAVAAIMSPLASTIAFDIAASAFVSI